MHFLRKFELSLHRGNHVEIGRSGQALGCRSPCLIGSIPCLQYFDDAIIVEIKLASLGGGWSVRK